MARSISIACSNHSSERIEPLRSIIGLSEIEQRFTLCFKLAPLLDDLVFHLLAKSLDPTETSAALPYPTS